MQGEAHWPLLARGVNLVGYARGGLGLGETLRRMALALHEVSVPFSLTDLNVNLGLRGRDDRLASWVRPDNPHPVNLCVVAAAEMPTVRAHLGEDFFSGRTTVGYWFWELERFPAEWTAAQQCVDVVWAPTNFIARSLEHALDRPIPRVLHPVAIPPRPPDPSQAAGRPYTFFFSFDFHSSVVRKNPFDVVRAFRLAFPNGHEQTRLVIKSSHSEADPGAHARLSELCASDGRITWIEGYVPHEDMVRLMADCDAYVSLHRAEGFGQGMAEAMAWGKPVVATGYSGNLDFMDAGNSLLVPWEPVRIEPGEYPCSEGQFWAQPDVEQAAAFMQHLVRHPEHGHALGARARRDLMRRHGTEAFVSALERALRVAPSTGRAT